MKINSVEPVFRAERVVKLGWTPM